MRVMFLLVLMVLGSSLGVIQMKYRTRLLFSEVQGLQHTLDQYEEERIRLQLERNILTERGRIEKVAREKLGMVFPEKNAVITVGQ